MTFSSYYFLKRVIQKILFFTCCLSVTIARADGLQTAASSIVNLRNGLMIVVPAIATLVLVAVGTLYMKSMIERSTLINWVLGALIAGSACPIASYFFSGVS
ncbi:MAG: hypothetical protein KIT27_08365 [Legionellales bacterium]|nr:hypothetical protein [Legionellales bacterium]